MEVTSMGNNLMSGGAWPGSSWSKTWEERAPSPSASNRDPEIKSGAKKFQIYLPVIQAGEENVSTEEGYWSS